MDSLVSLVRSCDGHVTVLCGSTTHLPGVTSTLIKEGFCLWECSGCKVDESRSLLNFTHVLRRWNKNCKVTLFSGSWKIPASFSHAHYVSSVLLASFPVLHHSYCHLQYESSALFVLQAMLAVVEDWEQGYCNILQSESTVEWMQQWPRTRATWEEEIVWSGYKINAAIATV